MSSILRITRAIQSLHRALMSVTTDNWRNNVCESLRVIAASASPGNVSLDRGASGRLRPINRLTLEGEDYWNDVCMGKL